jgi:hypothetical protein
MAGRQWYWLEDRIRNRHTADIESELCVQANARKTPRLSNDGPSKAFAPELLRPPRQALSWRAIQIATTKQATLRDLRVEQRLRASAIEPNGPARRRK